MKVENNETRKYFYDIYWLDLTEVFQQYSEIWKTNEAICLTCLRKTN